MLFPSCDHLPRAVVTIIINWRHIRDFESSENAVETNVQPALFKTSLKGLDNHQFNIPLNPSLNPKIYFNSTWCWLIKVIKVFLSFNCNQYFALSGNNLDHWSLELDFKLPSSTWSWNERHRSVCLSSNLLQGGSWASSSCATGVCDNCKDFNLPQLCNCAMFNWCQWWLCSFQALKCAAVQQLCQNCAAAIYSCTFG